MWHVVNGYGDQKYDEKSPSSSLIFEMDDSLFLAIKQRNLNLLTRLAETADLNVCHPKFGYSPLHRAVVEGEKDIVNQLIASKACVNIIDKNGYSPLYSAIRQYKNKVVKLLIDAKVDVNAQNKEVHCPLYIAAECGNDNAVQQLIAAKSDINYSANSGRSSLHIAAMKGEVGIASQIIAAKANINAVDETGRTPLYVASRWGKEDILTILLEAQADFNICIKNGTSPVCRAAILSHKAIVTRLVAASSTCSIELFILVCENGWVDTAILVCNKLSECELSKMLLKRPTKNIIIPKSAIRRGKDAILRFLKSSTHAMSSTIKLLIVGQARAGKTTLLNAMAGIHTESVQSTIGVYTMSEETSFGAKNLLFKCWDFAGQNSYQNTHSIFISKSHAIYIVCVNISEPFEQIKAQLLQWLSFLQNHLPPSSLLDNRYKVLLCGTWTDKIYACNSKAVAKSKISHIESFMLQVCSKFSKLPMEPTIALVSGKENIGLAEIRSKIATLGQQLAQSSYMLVPQLWLKIANKIKEQKNSYSKQSLIVFQDEAFKQNFVYPALDVPRIELDEEWKENCIEIGDYLHDIGAVIKSNSGTSLNEIYCTEPAILSRVLAILVAPASHLKTLSQQEDNNTNYTSLDSSRWLVPLSVVGDRLKSFWHQEFEAKLNNKQIVELLKQLQRLDFCILLQKVAHKLLPISDDTRLGSEENLFVFVPSLAPSTSIIQLPPIPISQQQLLTSTSIRDLRFAGTCYKREPSEGDSIVSAALSSVSFSKLVAKLINFYDTKYRLYSNLIMLDLSNQSSGAQGNFCNGLLTFNGERSEIALVLRTSENEAISQILQVVRKEVAAIGCEFGFTDILETYLCPICIQSNTFSSTLTKEACNESDAYVCSTCQTNHRFSKEEIIAGVNLSINEIKQTYRWKSTWFSSVINDKEIEWQRFTALECFSRGMTIKMIEEALKNDPTVTSSQWQWNAENFDISLWLKQVQLPEYISTFVENGYDDWELICCLDEDDLNEMSISNRSHRDILLSISQKVAGYEAQMIRRIGDASEEKAYLKGCKYIPITAQDQA